ncbi:uncharacterized protein LOC141788274 [Halichoeres trimaculatus]|uniref:uncharacterized protein LOC141788274 n=1 Tax=Halichoeres trimaculatus TaxID=147232 RepID=UPI003D9DD312
MIADAPVTTIADAPVTMIADAPVTKIADAPVTTIPDTPVTATPDAPVKTATDQNNSSSVNATEAEEGFQNSTISPTHPKTDPSLPDSSSNTNFTTILAPAVPASKESTTTNTSESVNKTVVVKPNPTKLPEATHKPTMLLSTPPSNSWTTGFIPVTATVARTNAPEEGEDADKAAASGSSSDRGLASDATTRRHSAWGAILGTAVAVMCVGLVAYVILKNKHKRDFSHRKLVEEFPSNPVHRLDNNEPLDLNFGGSAYYNPGLQGDNIQMTNFP